MELQKVLEYFNFARAYFCKRRGLLIAEALFLIIYLFGISQFSVLERIAKLLGDHKYLFLLLSVWLFFSFCIFIFWLFHRKLPVFKEDEIGILFICNIDYEIQKSIDHLMSSIRYHMKTHLGKNTVKIKIATSNNIPVSLEDNHYKRVLSNSRLIIWGDISHSKENGDTIVSLKKLNFTSLALIIPINPKEQIKILPNILSALSGRKLTINEKHSSTDLETVSKNIYEVSMFILGALMLLERKSEYAIKILEELWGKIKNIKTNSVYEVNFKNMVKLALADSYFLRSGQLIFGTKNEISNSTQMREALDLLLKSRNLDPNNSKHYLDLGFVYFQLEQFEKSRQAINIAKSFAPKNNALPYYSHAFLDMFSGIYIDRAIKTYKVAFEKETPAQESLVNIVIFIQNAIHKYPQKIFLKLALGLINKNKIDSSLALKDFNEFIELAKSYSENHLDINPYINFAKEQIREIQSNA